MACMARPVTSNSNVLGYRAKECEVLRLEATTGAARERKGAKQATSDEQRLAGVSVDARSSDQVSDRVEGTLDVCDVHGLPSCCDSPTDGLAKIKPETSLNHPGVKAFHEAEPHEFGTLNHDKS
jgi:hypothetical protein